MRRRTFLLGVGGIAIGGGTLFGSGAFSSMTMDRRADTHVVDDSAGLLSLTGTTKSGAGGVTLNVQTLDGDAADDLSGVMMVSA